MKVALASVAQLDLHPESRKVMGLIPSQSKSLGCRFDPHRSMDASLSH